MQLNALLYRSIVSQLNGDTTGDKTSLRRTEPRVGLRAWANLIRVHCDDEGYRYERLRANVTDLSWGGVRLVMTEHLRRGDSFLLHLPSETTGPLFVKYVVMHVVQVDQNRLRAVGAKAIGVYEVGHGELSLRCDELAANDDDIHAPRVSDQMRKLLTAHEPAKVA
ncbi:MAG: PilZ domain-containing protein [Planctomycetota bacterium]